MSPGVLTESVSTCPISNPGSTCISFQKLFNIKPQPITRITATAVSPATSALRSALRPPVILELPWRSIDAGFEAVAVQAGIRPNVAPVSSDASSAKAAMRGSRPTSSARGSMPALIDIRTPTPQTASAKPSTPPAMDSVRLSVTNWRTSQSTAGAQRKTDRDLARSSGTAGQQQVGEVGTGDQQHQAGGAEQHQQRRPDLADHRLMEWGDDSTRPSFVAVGIGLGETGHDRTGLGDRSVDGDARGQPSQHLLPANRPSVRDHGVGDAGDRHPHVDLA